MEENSVDNLTEAERRKIFKSGLKTSKYLRSASETLIKSGLPTCLAAHLSIRSKQYFHDVQSVASTSTSGLSTNFEMAYLDLEIKDRCKRCWMNLRKSGAYQTQVQQTPKAASSPSNKSRLLATCSYCGQTMVCKSAQFDRNLAYPKNRKRRSRKEEETVDIETISITSFNTTLSPTVSTPIIKDTSFASSSSRKKKKASKLSLLVAQERETTQTSLASFLNSL